MRKFPSKGQAQLDQTKLTHQKLPKPAQEHVEKPENPRSPELEKPSQSMECNLCLIPACPRPRALGTRPGAPGTLQGWVSNPPRQALSSLSMGKFLLGSNLSLPW